MLIKENLSDKLAGIIGTKIIHNELKSGEIIYETQIAKEWGVSRSPVRDALRMLEQNRLVERDSRGNYRVTQFSPASIQNYYETIDILFQYAFAKAAKNANKDILNILKNALEKMENSLKETDIELYLEGVFQFARVILKTSGNPIVEQMAITLMPNAQRVQWTSLTHNPENLKEVIWYVRQSYENITNKNPLEAAKNFSAFALIHVKAATDSLEAEYRQSPSKTNSALKKPTENRPG
ncbi:MAG: GntR family transcriptional regulator [Deltaproteobacteria bacterium]|nr:GntR family transcriptional regulator [Deltaproteobacteria bacterium]